MIVCVFKTGGDFDPGYVERLAAGVHRTLSLPYRFLCLSDVPHKIATGSRCHIDQVIPLQYDWPGWWAKMEIFGLPGSVLYFDLDTVLIDSIDELAGWIIQSESCLLMLRDFYTNKRSSGILGWNGDLRWVLDSFVEQHASGVTWHQRLNVTWLLTKGGRFRGDQEWLRCFLPDHPELSIVLAQNVVSGIYSYKVHVRGNGLIPKDAKVVCFHGRPRPHEIDHGWMQDYWRRTDVLQSTKTIH